MRKILIGLVLFLAVACKSDAARVAKLEAELNECREQVRLAQDHPAAPSVTMAAGTEAILPTEITVGERTYEILPILRDKEESVTGDLMVARAKEANAHLGKEDGEYLLTHQDEIPVSLRSKMVFVFTNWPRPDNPGHVYYVFWYGGRWVESWCWLDDDWDGCYRVLRRKSK